MSLHRLKIALRGDHCRIVSAEVFGGQAELDALEAKYAEDLAIRKGYGDDFALLEKIETLTPQLFRQYKGVDRAMCANVDLYSGLVYRMLDIPVEMYTPLFAIARVAGWCAHRMEEYCTSNKIIRPGYKCISKPRDYIALEDRD